MVTITVTYFGPLKTLHPPGSEILEWGGGNTDDLLALLRSRGPDWAQALQPQRIYKVAVNRELLNGPAPIRDGDEIAILPPVTGG